MSVILLVLSIVKDDGLSLLATLLLSLLSSLIGLGAKWELELPKRGRARDVPNSDVDLPERGRARDVPDSDVVIVYPHGAIMVVKCNEEIQRQLYWHVEKCTYKLDAQLHRLVALVGTLMLMFGVIFLANATLFMQTFWAGAYIILNAAFWLVAALDRSRHWDLSGFVAEPIKLLGGGPGEHKPPNFTQALWKAVAITRSSAWARHFDVAPYTDAWEEWLKSAQHEANQADEPAEKDSLTLKLPDWDASARLSELLFAAKQAQLAARQV